MTDESYQVTRGFVDVRGGRISYLRAGSGQPLVLLHSLALAAEMWTPLLGDFIDTFEVVAIDLRGHGESSYHGEVFSVEDMANDVRLVLDELDLKRVHILGLSMGGCVAISFAATFPDYVDRLALCDTTAWYGPDAPQAWAVRARTALSRPRLMQIPFQVDRWFGQRFRRVNPRAVSHVVDIFLQTSPEVHAKACFALGAFDNTALLPNITAPTLVVTGEDDDATPPNMGQRLGSEIAGGRFVMAKGLRHFALIESPFVRGAVVQHLRGLEVDEAAVSGQAACCIAYDRYSNSGPEKEAR